MNANDTPTKPNHDQWNTARATELEERIAAAHYGIRCSHCGSRDNIKLQHAMPSWREPEWTLHQEESWYCGVCEANFSHVISVDVPQPQLYEVESWRISEAAYVLSVGDGDIPEPGAYAMWKDLLERASVIPRQNATGEIILNAHEVVEWAQTIYKWKPTSEMLTWCLHRNATKGNVVKQTEAKEPIAKGVTVDWSEIRIHIDEFWGFRIQKSFNSKWEKTTLYKLGLTHKQKIDKPLEAAKLLRAMAKCNGVMSKAVASAEGVTTYLPKEFQLLNEVLMEYFGASNKPILNAKEGGKKYWDWSFDIKADTPDMAHETDTDDEDPWKP